MLGANVMWGLMSPLAKFVMGTGGVTPMTITGLRVAGAMVLFWTASLFGQRERVASADMLKLFAASLLAIVFNQGCFIFGVGLSSPVDASVITTSMPLLAMVFAALYLKEPVSGKKVGGIAAGAAGALLLILGGHAAEAGRGGGNSYVWGDLLVLLAQCSYALYIVLFKNFVNRYSPVTIMKWMFTYAFVCVLPFSFGGVAATDWPALGGRLRPTVAGMYNYIQPLVASIVAVCWGMDRFNVVKVLAVVLIFGGVYLVTVSPSRAGLEAAEHGHETGRNGGEGAGCRAEDDGIRLSDKYKRPR